MAWLTRSNYRLVVSAVAAVCGNSSYRALPFSGALSKSLNKIELGEDRKDTQLGLTPRRRLEVRISEISSSSVEPSHDEGCDVVHEEETSDGRWDLLKHRFLSFKKHKYLNKFEQFKALAEAQSPKFMVIACADSRVCPSNILGFQPGEAFMVRNVANLVPPLENGPSETNAALEFAVNTLEVENILIIGHSSCRGIQSLMSMQDGAHSSFVGRWVIKGQAAKLKTKRQANHLSFDEQCRHCEKESVKDSLANLLSYPWIKDRARRGLLSVHGGYYDFSNCTFEKWTVDIDFDGDDRGGSIPQFFVKDKAIWS